jgi:hypothetical protein
VVDPTGVKAVGLQEHRALAREKEKSHSGLSICGKHMNFGCPSTARFSDRFISCDATTLVQFDSLKYSETSTTYNRCNGFLEYRFEIENISTYGCNAKHFAHKWNFKKRPANAANRPTLAAQR